MLLILTFAVSLIALPAANAHTPALSIPTWAYLNIAPNPVGVDQTAYVNFWLDKPPPTASGAYGDRWQNMTVTITTPTGSTEKLGPFSSDAVGGAWAEYVPHALGTYTFVFNYPGQTIEGANPAPGVPPFGGTLSPEFVGDYYEGSTSNTVTLNVQQQPIPPYPSNPLPTGYWTRPIQSVNGEWAQISGNWLGLGVSTFAATGMYNASGNFNPYTTAPNTAHIMWTKPAAIGGLIGGEFGGSETSNYYSTSQYEPKFAPIIMNGVLYYTLYPGSSTSPEGWVAVDVRTGQTLWTKNTTEVLKCGQTLNFIAPNQYGAIPYLWSIPSSATTYAFTGGTFYGMYDAMTGNWILNIVGALALQMIEEDQSGSLIGYYVNSTAGTLNMWNSTRCIIRGPTGTGDLNTYSWRPAQGANIPFEYGIQWSAPLPTNISGVPFSPALSIVCVASDVVLMRAVPGGAGLGFTNPGWQVEAGYGTKTGQLLWGPVNRTELLWSRVAMGNPVGFDGYGVFCEYTEETEAWDGYSLLTGAHLWGPVSFNTNPWGYYGAEAVPAYGNLYAWDFGGAVGSINLLTGHVDWTFDTGTSGYETPYGVYPIWTFTVGTVADGKLYVPEGHMYSPPLFKGAKQLCINTTTGELVWSIMGFDVTSAPAIADGYMVTLNAYDNQIYCYGKAQSGTTITVQNDVIPHGTPVLIKGTVTDQSPGTTCLGIPAAGTPAISDASMSPWMEYLYMQQPKPTNATGVSVHLTATDPNGNFQDLGTVTTDIKGNFVLEYQPPVTGLYTVTATFSGSESYYSSDAETSFVTFTASSVAPAVTPTPTQTTAPTSTPAQTVSPSASPSQAPQPTSGIPTTTYIVIAAIVVIIVVVAAAVILRRRK